MWRTVTALLGLTAARGGWLGTLALVFLLFVGGIMALVIFGLITSR